MARVEGGVWWVALVDYGVVMGLMGGDILHVSSLGLVWVEGRVLVGCRAAGSEKGWDG